MHASCTLRDTLLKLADLLTLAKYGPKHRESATG